MKIEFRPCVIEDLPSLAELWQEVFGDEPEYIHRCFSAYPYPERMFLGEVEGKGVSMSLYFPCTFHRWGKAYSAAYLYAVATHPSYRGQDNVGQMMANLRPYLREQGVAVLTTVPAEPSLHGFFARHGFMPYFQEYRQQFTSSLEDTFTLSPLSAAMYEQKREAFLQKMPYLQIASEGFRFQESVCALGQGGMFQGSEGDILVLEEAEEGVFIGKEYLGKTPPVGSLFRDYGIQCLQLRSPFPMGEEPVPFGMIQWLQDPPSDWTQEERGYHGLAFD